MINPQIRNIIFVYQLIKLSMNETEILLNNANKSEKYQAANNIITTYGILLEPEQIFRAYQLVYDSPRPHVKKMCHHLYLQQCIFIFNTLLDINKNMYIAIILALNDDFDPVDVFHCYGSLNNSTKNEKLINNYLIFVYQCIIMKYLICILSFILLAISIHNTTNDDLTGLSQIYNQMNGPNWIDNELWMSNISYCTWYGVICNKDRRVTNLILPYNNLTGHIPNMNSTLNYVEYIDMSMNYITGNLIALAKLSSLTSFDVSLNLLNEEFNSYFLNSVYTYINLEYNYLYGNLTTIQGPLTVLYLNNNYFSGSFPKLNAPHISLLDLSNNNFQGSLPDDFNNMSQLSQLFLSNNYFYGSLPSSLGLTNLTILNINNNQFNGNIPGTFTNLVNLKEFYANNNLLDEGLNYLTHVAVVEIINNKFTELPSEFFSHNLMITFMARHNMFRGYVQLYCPTVFTMIDL